MRSEIIRIYKAVHSWTGILAGLALFIAFYAGALTVFKSPIRDWVTPPSSIRMTPLEQTKPLIEAILAEHPQLAREFTIQLTPSSAVPTRFSWQEHNSSDDDSHGNARVFGASLTENGQVITQELQPSGLPEFLDTLHRVVGLPVDNDLTRWIMGVVAVLYALAIISGIIILLPSLLKDFFALRVGKNLKRMWLDAHNIVGVISLPFHLIMALTAVTFAFHDVIYQGQNQAWHGGKFAAASSGNKNPERASAIRPMSDLLPPQQLLANIQQIAPDFEVDALQYQKVDSGKPRVRAWGHNDQAVMPRAQGGFLVLDPFSGKLVSKDLLPGQQTTANASISSFFALHMASFGGVMVRWMYFILAMAGAWLFYSGNLLWLESRRKKTAHNSTHIPEQRKDTRFMAALTIGISLGCVMGISLAMAITKVASLTATDSTLYLPAYYLTLCAAIAWSFFRTAARAAIELLWACVLATLSIPLASLMVSATSGQYGQGWGVDLTAIVGSSLLCWLARSSQRRLNRGASDSVWSTTATRSRSESAGD